MTPFRVRHAVIGAAIFFGVFAVSLLVLGSAHAALAWMGPVTGYAVWVVFWIAACMFVSWRSVD